MSFLNPILALAGIACVAIPILIHILMRRRRRPVMWGAMRFLLEAYRQQRRRLRLEQILLLAARCLVVALVALALGRPILGRAGLLGGGGAVTLYLLVDNGLASSATPDGGEAALERHRAAALALIEQLEAGGGDRVALIALGGPARGLVSPASSNTAAVADLARELESTDSPTDIPGGLAIVREALAGAAAGPANSEGGRNVVVILSDFLAGSADTERKLPELAGADVVLMASTPQAAGPANISVAALEPLRPILLVSSGEAGGPPPQTPVRIVLKRSGPSSEAAATRVALAYSREQALGLAPAGPAGETVVRWSPGQTEATVTSIAMLAGAARGGGAGVLTATIDADAIAGDNTWRRPVEVRRTLKVGLVAPRRLGARPPIHQYEPADWVRIAIEPSEGPGDDSQIELLEIDPATLDAPRLAGLDAVVITAPDGVPETAWRRVRGFVDAGGLVFISPSARAAVQVWTDAATRDLGLPWTIAREARTWPDASPATIAPERPDLATTPDPLALLAPELAELANPVRILKSLVVDRGAGRNAPGTLLMLNDGLPLLLATAPGAREQAGDAPPQRGLVVLLTVAFSFDWTDLQARSLMLPLVQEILREGVGQARGVWATLAGNAPPAPGRALELRSTTDAAPASARVAGDRASEPFRHAGVWRAVDEGGASRGLVAVNADPAGARGEAQPPGAIAQWLGKATGGADVRWLEPGGAVPGGTGQAASLRSILQRGEDGTRFAVPLLLAALALALAELAMARWFSHAVIRGDPAPAGGAA